MAEKKKVAFGGKVIDLKKSGLMDVPLGDLFKKEYPKMQIPPTALMGAFWKKLRKLESKNDEVYFATPEELSGKKKKTKKKVK